MTEIPILIGAIALFCLLVFGTAWLAAGWMSAPPGWWRRTKKNRS